MIRAAGILFVTKDNQALFLKRGNGSDHPLEWAFPGGQLEGDETPEQAAIRETMEEAGRRVAPADLRPHTRSIARAEAVIAGDTDPAMPAGAAGALPASAAPAQAPSEDVDFTTFLCRIAAPFVPELCDEHTGYAWADIATPPEPLHPGARLALDRLTMDELGVARAMAAGSLTSPQRYQNVSLFAIRITGTGVSYRQALDEFVWRDPGVYLNDDFLARCNGLAVIMEHPDKAVLTSAEFDTRAIGSIMLPYIKGDEVWGIAKVYDDAAIRLMSDPKTALSTSPSVVFSDPGVNSRLRLEDGSALLIEGKPSLLDHIAICPLGVWDKGGEPTGVINDSNSGDLKMATEEMKDDAARKDAEDKERADRARADAEAGEKLDKILAHVDSLGKRMDAMEATETPPKADAEEEGEDKPKADAEEEGEAKEKADAEEDIARLKADADVEEAKEKADKAIADAADARRRIADVEKMLPKQLSDADYAAMADAQAKADRVFQAFGDSAPRPLQGEDLNGYRRRLANRLREHSPALKDVNLHAINDAAAFEFMEKQVYADAMAAALSPVDLPEGVLREMRSPDLTGRQITTFAGTAGTWMRPMGGQRSRVTSINRE